MGFDTIVSMPSRGPRAQAGARTVVALATRSQALRVKTAVVKAAVKSAQHYRFEQPVVARAWAQSARPRRPGHRSVTE